MTLDYNVLGVALCLSALGELELLMYEAPRRGRWTHRAHWSVVCEPQRQTARARSFPPPADHGGETVRRGLLRRSLPHFIGGCGTRGSCRSSGCSIDHELCPLMSGDESGTACPSRAWRRGWAVALFDSGSAIGAAVAPIMVVGLYHGFGSWRPVFMVTGALGSVGCWSGGASITRRRLTPGSVRKNAITFSTAGRRRRRDLPNPNNPGSHCLACGEPGASSSAGLLTDPVWYFVADWFASYLVSKGFRLENALIGFWVPFLAADLGNFFGGGFSSHLIKRGWPVVRARKFLVVVCGLGMTCLIPAAFLNNFALLIGLFTISTFSYAAWSTMALTLPSDLYPSSQVATVSGMSGTGSGLGTILSTFLIGWSPTVTLFFSRCSLWPAPCR